MLPQDLYHYGSPSPPIRMSGSGPGKNQATSGSGLLSQPTVKSQLDSSCVFFTYRCYSVQYSRPFFFFVTPQDLPISNHPLLPPFYHAFCPATPPKTLWMGCSLVTVLNTSAEQRYRCGFDVLDSQQGWGFL
ncbi:hypothetical protein BaRGS_00012179 [Batillaria attramentaria]|uniref:Uncharacterized protein n=1 Tax=Batillaria attramentaria TaxID=370345 RepID=A0ABD0LC29_9CAEN